MAFWNFVIYHKSDFTSIDFNGTIETDTVIDPIYIRIEDNDDWLGGTLDPTPAYDPIDTNGQQTIVGSTDPALLGLYIEFHHPVSAQDSSLYDTSTSWFTLVDIAIGGVSDYIMAFENNVNTELTASTIYTDTNPSNGRFAAPYATTALPCFTLGTRIETPMGAQPIEMLEVGDLVMTADHGPQRIRWKGLRHITGTALAANPKQRPIKIEKGALGRGPVRDLFVSRQHRMLLQGPAVARHFGADAVFAPAIHLVGLPGVSEVQPAAGVTYLHILCDQHEVLFAEGAATESLYLGPTLLGDASSAEAAALWSDLQRDWQGGTPARPIARPQAIRRFVARTRRAEPALA